MNEHGLRIISDPRWVVALPGQDVAAEVTRQMGVVGAEDVSDGSSVQEAVVGVLQGAIDDNAWWAAALVLDEGGDAIVVRSSLEWAGASDAGSSDDSMTADTIYDMLAEDSRDADYVTHLDLVSTRLGTAVRHQMIVPYGDGTLGDYLGFSLPYAGGVLAMRTFSTATGWIDFFAPMVDSMLLSLIPDEDRSFGDVTLVSYVAAMSDGAGE